MAAQRPYRQRRQYLTPTVWELSFFLSKVECVTKRRFWSFNDLKWSKKRSRPNFDPKFQIWRVTKSTIFRTKMYAPLFHYLTLSTRSNRHHSLYFLVRKIISKLLCKYCLIRISVLSTSCVILYILLRKLTTFFNFLRCILAKKVLSTTR